MQDAVLSSEEQELVKSKDETRIRQYIQGSGEGDTFVVVINSSQVPEKNRICLMKILLLLGQAFELLVN